MFTPSNNPVHDESNVPEIESPLDLDCPESFDKEETLQSTKLAKLPKILRAESALVAGPIKQLNSFSELMNEKVAQLVDTLQRWGDGGYGNEPGEDPNYKEEMQTFVNVALENIPASFLVRVLSHLERGGTSVLQSATTMIMGAKRQTPTDGPLEKAIKKQDIEAVERFLTYLLVVDRVATEHPPFTPLKFLTEWRNELGNHGKEWVDHIVDDACQYLRHHIKLQKRYQENEHARLEALDKFKNSAKGKKYLDFRKAYCIDGLPKNRAKRFEILNSESAVKWNKRSAKLEAASDMRELIKNNPELNLLVKHDMEYRWLTKPNTPPTWTPISYVDHPRWLFIPSNLIAGELRREKNSLYLSINLPQKAQDGSISNSNVEIKLEATAKLKQMTNTKNAWAFNWPDDISGNTFEVKIKGVRFERASNNQWVARFSYEKSTAPFSERVTQMYKDIKDKKAPQTQPGDIVCAFTLDAVSKGGKKNHTRVGWLKVYGITANGAKELYSDPVSSVVEAKSKSVPNKTGRAKAWRRDPNRKEQNYDAPTRGESTGATLAQIKDTDRELKRNIRLLRILKDPERQDEALEWVGSILKAHQKRTQDANTKTPELLRWDKLYSTIRDGNIPSEVQLKPFKDRIKNLRNNLKGMKDTYRNSVAKQVVRAVHDARTGKLDKRIYYFQQKHPGGEILFADEYRKGKGPGPYKPRPQNRTLALLGPSKIHELISEKFLMLDKPIPEFSFVPTNLKKECPSCEHTNVNPPKDKIFSCESKNCDEERPAVEVATYNLAKRFFIPC